MTSKTSRLLRAILANRIYSLLFFTVLVIAVMSGLSPYFFSLYTIEQLARLGAVLAILSLAQNLIIISGDGGVDLSPGSVVSLSGVVLGLLHRAGVPILLAVFVVLLLGAFLGLVNGFNITVLRLPPLIATLGTLNLYGGLALVLAQKGSIGGFPPSFAWLGQGSLLFIPAQLYYVALLWFACLWWIKHSQWGRELYLVGMNSTAAALAGINVNSIRRGLYVLSGVVSAFCGVVLSSWLMTAKADVGQNLELQAITVVMIGGTLLEGGSGRLEATLLGVIIVMSIGLGLEMANIDNVWQTAILGASLIAAVWINRYQVNQFGEGE